MNFQENEVPDIHPEIRKFWEDQGWKLMIKPAYQQLARVKDGQEMTAASWRYKPINYFFEGSFVSEKKMLRLIKLKMFL